MSSHSGLLDVTMAHIVQLNMLITSRMNLTIQYKKTIVCLSINIFKIRRLIYKDRIVLAEARFTDFNYKSFFFIHSITV